MKVAEVTPYFLRSFMQEAILMSRTNHQHVVSLLGTVVAPPSLGLVFEYMNYGSLRDLLCDEEVELTFPLVCQLLSHAADGICFLHSIDIVHRDLKPENMLLNYDSASDVWKLKLTDMGDATQVLTVWAKCSAHNSRFPSQHSEHFSWLARLARLQPLQPG